MRTVGIKLADGSFYPIMEEGSAQKKTLELTTANDNQTCVMVDLYRSKTCSMDDAEYIDTLKIENLNAHQNGEPSISFDVGLDEDGELSASIADPETGATSNSQITLVSRTAEERLVADDYSISGDEPAIEDPFVEDPSVEETSVDEPVVEEAPAEEDSGNGAAVAAGVVAGAGLLAAAGIMAANKNKDGEDEAPEDITMSDDDISEVTGDTGLDDFSFDEAPAEEAPAETESLEDFSFDETPSEDTIADEIISDDLGAVADDTITEEDPFAADETITEEPAADDTFATDETITEEDPFAADETITEEDPFAADETITEEDPFAADDTVAADETISDETLPNMDFDMPEETSDISDSNGLTDDDFFNNEMDSDSDPTPVPAQELNFSGLYDKETEMGESAPHDDDDIKKKTRAPVIICVICAIICIIATLLVLLVLPGKFNLRQKHAEKKAQTAIEKQAEAPAPVEEKKPEPVPQAKEDEVVVIEKAEEVKPVPPPAAETKSKNVTYKIKWGDTLWDIADTYYKNPWRYKKIANYNGIKNPDHIISGTVIIIPAE